MTILSKTKYEASMENATRKKLATIAEKAAEFPFHGYIEGKESNLDPIIRFSQSGLQEKPTDYGVQRLYIIAADKQDLKSPSGRMNARPVIWLAVLPGKNLLKVIFA